MIPSKTTEELNVIASDLYKQHIFTDCHIPKGEENMLGSIFMVIGLGGLAELPQEDLEDLGLIYEYLDKASPRSINGYPVFFSTHFLNRADASYVWDKYFKIKEAVEGVV